MPEITQQQGLIPVNRVKCDSITIYEITEWELDIIKKGENSLFLNLGLSLVSFFITFFITLLTVDLKDRIFTIFIVACMVTGIWGIVLIIFYFKVKWDFSCVIKKIEKRTDVEKKQPILKNDSLEISW